MEIYFALGGFGLEVGRYAAEAEAWLLVCCCGEGAVEVGGEGGALEWAEGGCEGWEGAARGSKEGRCHCVVGRKMRAEIVRVEKKIRS